MEISNDFLKPISNFDIFFRPLEFPPTLLVVAVIPVVIARTVDVEDTQGGRKADTQGLHAWLLQRKIHAADLFFQGRFRLIYSGLFWGFINFVSFFCESTIVSITMSLEAMFA